MKTTLLSFILIFLIIGCQQVPQKNIQETHCIVINVKHYRIGEKHTLQTTPEWRATTNCGTTHLLRNPVSVGDTLLIKTVFYKD